MRAAPRSRASYRYIESRGGACAAPFARASGNDTNARGGEGRGAGGRGKAHARGRRGPTRHGMAAAVEPRPLTLALLEHPQVILAHVLARHLTAAEGAIAHRAPGHPVGRGGPAEPRERPSFGEEARRHDGPRVQHHGRLAGARRRPPRRRAAIGRTARAPDSNRPAAALLLAPLRFVRERGASV